MTGDRHAGIRGSRGLQRPRRPDPPARARRPGPRARHLNAPQSCHAASPNNHDEPRPAPKAPLPTPHGRRPRKTERPQPICRNTPSHIMSPAGSQPGSSAEVSLGVRGHTAAPQRAHAPPKTYAVPTDADRTALTTRAGTSKRGLGEHPRNGAIPTQRYGVPRLGRRRREWLIRRLGVPDGRAPRAGIGIVGVGDGRASKALVRDAYARLVTEQPRQTVMISSPQLSDSGSRTESARGASRDCFSREGAR